MEIFLQLLDEIDDAVALLRSAWPRLLGLMLAFSLLLATGFGFLHYPRLGLPLGAAVLSAVLFERLRRRHRVDPSPAER